jgi:soluble lytic murein transglycosylase-like protein
MTLPLSRAAIQRLIDPPSVQRSAALPTLNRTTFASVLARASAQPRALPQSLRGATPARVSLPGVSTSRGSGPVPYQDLVEAAARKYGLDPSLLAAVAQTESGFNPKAQSQVGAKGLMQLMDATARNLGITDSFDPAQSLDGGARFLSGLLTEFKGDVRLALAAYNAGPVAVKKYGGIPPYQETQRYVPKVLAQADTFRRLFAAKLPAPESS